MALPRWTARGVKFSRPPPPLCFRILPPIHIPSALSLSKWLAVDAALGDVTEAVLDIFLSPRDGWSPKAIEAVGYSERQGGRRRGGRKHRQVADKTFFSPLLHSSSFSILVLPTYLSSPLCLSFELPQTPRLSHLLRFSCVLPFFSCFYSFLTSLFLSPLFHSQPLSHLLPSSFTVPNSSAPLSPLLCRISTPLLHPPTP